MSAALALAFTLVVGLPFAVAAATPALALVTATPAASAITPAPLTAISRARAAGAAAVPAAADPARRVRDYVAEVRAAIGK